MCHYKSSTDEGIIAVKIWIAHWEVDGKGFQFIFSIFILKEEQTLCK